MGILTEDHTTIAFSDYKKIEPEDLISLSKEYNDHIPELKTYLKKFLKRVVEIHFVRIKDVNGGLIEKTIMGTIEELTEKYFKFSAFKDISGTKYEIPYVSIVRFDNVLGIIPVLPKFKGVKIYENNSSKKTKIYFDQLEKIKILMKKSVGTIHTATLYYRYSKKKPVLRAGNYQVLCEIKKVNNSNVEYKHCRTYAYVSKQESYVVCVPLENEVDRFIAPDRYLWKVEIIFGKKCQINFGDEN